MILKSKRNRLAKLTEKKSSVDAVTNSQIVCQRSYIVLSMSDPKGYFNPFLLNVLG